MEEAKEARLGHSNLSAVITSTFYETMKRCEVDGKTVHVPVEATKQQGGSEYATDCVYKCRICFAEFGESDVSYHLVQNRMRHRRRRFHFR